MEIHNALDIKKGKRQEYNKMGTLTQPIQFIPAKDKDDEWHSWNMDWFEWQGLKQLSRNARRLLKNYKLAKGIIDRSDYIVDDNNENSDIISALTEEDQTAFELKFYPIIPNVIKTLTSEFAKRNTKVTYRAVDDVSYNEMMEQRRSMIEKNLLQKAQMEMTSKLMEMGVDLGSEDAQQQLSPDNLKSLPEIEDFFRKKYTNIPEEWAQHQQEADYGRFYIDELEIQGFKDMLITDREFWHFRMDENDYSVELWNPVLTAYHKSPSTDYISNGNWVTNMEMLSVSDVIDKYGWLMTEEQHETLEQLYPIRSANYAVQGLQNDGSFYDGTKSHAWNTNMPSLAYRQYTSMFDNFINKGSDIVSWILGESEDFMDFGQSNLLRVTTVYWKSQVRIGHLTKIDENGEISEDIISEEYQITDKPIYNNAFIKDKDKTNLIFGEHIDWIWINQTRGGVKIGPNISTHWGMTSTDGLNPIYLGIGQNKMGVLKFQFKGDRSLYGCKLPVEGKVFSERNTRSVSLVDLMKPFQIGYNIVNNQIADILVDELGTIIALDQNSLPKHSMGEDWGKGNYAKAYVAMKNFSVLPFDTAIANTESGLAMQHMQVLNLEQTNRLMSRVQLANYFKAQAFENIGVTPQRMGQQIGQHDTATGIEQAVSGSYAQTEEYFIDHCDRLMPRVHQMRTDLAQYYQSNNPSIRLQYLTASEERVDFQINGTDLMLRDLNVFATTKANHRKVLEELRKLAMENNTSGASIYDLGNMLMAESIPEIQTVMKAAEEKTNKQRQEEQQHQQQLQQEAIQAQQQEQQMKMQFEADQNEKDRQADLLVAQIRAASSIPLDTKESDYNSYSKEMEGIRDSEQYQDQMSLKKQGEDNKMQQHSDKMDLEKQKLDLQKQISDNQLRVARENKNRFDKKTDNKNSKK